MYCISPVSFYMYIGPALYSHRTALPAPKCISLYADKFEARGVVAQWTCIE